MDEHHGSDDLPVGPSEIVPKGTDSESNDGNGIGIQQEKKDEEVKERVGESLVGTESQQGDLSSCDKHAVEANLETLIVFPSSKLEDRSFDLQGNPNTLNSGAKEEENKETVEPPEKEVTARQAAQTPLTPTRNQLQLAVYSPPTQTGNQLQVTLSTPNVARTSASDGYNWRKYGQKQVKSPTTGSRSYYRCTQSDCSAKKIECLYHSGHVIETVYKSEHSHDPPQKANSIRKSKSASSNVPTADNSVLLKPVNVLKDSDPSTSSKAQEEAPCSTDEKPQKSSNINGNGQVVLKEEHLDEPEPKRRKEKGDLIHPDSPEKPEKKPKYVVHAAGDVGISGDGYRWRKYGQKMVKGNPHPRNYYRCTSAGCPVRKHIETAIDNSDAVIVTYKGVHDHDTPVPKKRHGPPSVPLIAAAAPASMNNLQLEKPDSPQNQKISTKSSVDTEGELTGEAMELGGEKAIESARTLLSIGFEIKPC